MLSLPGLWGELKGRLGKLARFHSEIEQLDIVPWQSTCLVCTMVKPDAEPQKEGGSHVTHGSCSASYGHLLSSPACFHPEAFTLAVSCALE